MLGPTNQDPAIHQLAAYLFWYKAQDVGAGGLSAEVVATNGRILLDESVLRRVFGHRDVSETLLHRYQPKSALSRALQEAVEWCGAEQNMLGTLYADEIESGRPPDFRPDILAGIPLTPPRIINKIGRAETAGALALRTPLPAVVLCAGPTRDWMIRVATTRRALGVEYPMWLNVQGFAELPTGQSVAHGVFMIPVPSTPAGDKWDVAIPNSTRFVTRKTTYNEAGRVHYRCDCAWPPMASDA